LRSGGRSRRTSREGGKGKNRRFFRDQVRRGRIGALERSDVGRRSEGDRRNSRQKVQDGEEEKGREIKKNTAPQENQKCEGGSSLRRGKM